MSKDDQIAKLAQESLVGKDSSDSAIDNALLQAEELYAAFEAFIALYIQFSPVPWKVTVEDAWEDKEMQKKFVEVAVFIKGGNAVLPKSTVRYTPSTTKAASFLKLDVDSKCKQVLDAIRKSKIPITRAEIVEASGLPLCTVTGQVTPLLKHKHIRVAGRKLDIETGRHVETLQYVQG